MRTLIEVVSHTFTKERSANDGLRVVKESIKMKNKVLISVRYIVKVSPLEHGLYTVYFSPSDIAEVVIDENDYEKIKEEWGI